MPPKITVFMAAYNSENYISDSIKSILDQSFSDFELLIINDGSTDLTVDIIEKFNDPRIRLVHNDKNRGLTYTRNVALTEALGEYIAILDSDDIAIKNRLELQYNFFQQHPEYALCGGHGIYINQLAQPADNSDLTVPTGAEKIKMTLFFENTFVNSSVMFKTSIYQELNGYQEYAPAEDYELSIRIAEKYPVWNLDKILVKYRKHENNISTLENETAKLKLKAIKRMQISSLGISDSQNLGDILFSILIWDYKSYQFSDYHRLFSQIKSANRKLGKYPIKEFERILFEKWFTVIHQKRAKMNALALLFNKDLFDWSYLSMRQLRKTIKLSLKGIGRLSKWS